MDNKTIFVDFAIKMSCCVLCGVYHKQRLNDIGFIRFVDIYYLEDFDTIYQNSSRRQEIELCRECFNSFGIQRRHDHCSLEVIKGRKRKWESVEFDNISHLCLESTNYGGSQKDIKKIKYTDNRSRKEEVVSFDEREWLCDCVNDWFPYVANTDFFNSIIQMYEKKIEQVRQWKSRQDMSDFFFERHFPMLNNKKMIHCFSGVSFHFE